MLRLNMRSRFLLLGPLLLLVLGGCASGQTSGQKLVLPADSNISFYVERHEKDGRNLAESIAGSLAERGYAASHGAPDSAPDEATHIVRYNDQWSWDMRTFLANLRIEVRDPATGALIAYGQSVQNSMKAMGWTHETVIELALSEIFDSPEISN